MESAERKARAPRADGLRNRERVLLAARACFAVEGRSAQMDAIASEAGVSVATVYRHFPDKEALFGALVVENTVTAAGFAQVALTEDDPWASFAGFLTRCARLQSENRGLCEALVEGFALDRWAATLADHGLLDATEALLDRGRCAGVIRRDASAADVALIIGGLAGAMLSGGPLGGDWARLLTICLDGLRPPPDEVRSSA